MNSSSGLGIGTILFLIFLTLKLMGYIAWSWWWVTAPLWIPFAVFITAFLFLIGIGTSKTQSNYKRKR